jgi:hypothetical protein
MLGWVAAVMAMVSPSQPKPAVIQRTSTFSSVLACGGKCSRLFGRATAWTDPLGDEGGAGVHGVIATSCSR